LDDFVLIAVAQPARQHVGEPPHVEHAEAVREIRPVDAKLIGAVHQTAAAKIADVERAGLAAQNGTVDVEECTDAPRPAGRVASLAAARSSFAGAAGRGGAVRPFVKLRPAQLPARSPVLRRYTTTQLRAARYASSLRREASRERALRSRRSDARAR